MCLQFVIKDKLNFDGFGYKIYGTRNPYECFFGKYELGKEYKAKEIGSPISNTYTTWSDKIYLMASDQGFFGGLHYRSGFHIIPSLEDARVFGQKMYDRYPFLIVRVEFKEAHTLGLQCGIPTFVAETMKLLEEIP